MYILVSACLLGLHCRYNEKGELAPGIRELMEDHCLIPVCPEILGGLPTPRTPAERMGERVVNCLGEDVTEQYRKGAEEAAHLAKLYGCGIAVLKERSPSCGSGVIYDGSFTGRKIPGDGVAAARLKEMGVQIFGESEISRLWDALRGKKE